MLRNEEEDNKDDKEEEDGDVWNRDDRLDGKSINSLFHKSIINLSQSPLLKFDSMV